MKCREANTPMSGKCLCGTDKQTWGHSVVRVNYGVRANRVFVFPATELTTSRRRVMLCRGSWPPHYTRLNQGGRTVPCALNFVVPMGTWTHAACP
jgi:hypothetical protein